MYLVKIEDIENENNLVYKFQGKIEELDDCEVSAVIEFENLGDYIQAQGNVKGQVTLECDRCLEKFTQNLDFKIDEMFAKNTLLEDYGQELELSSGQFVTDLEGAKEIDVYDLLYQSVILALPNKRVCGINCNEGLFASDEAIKNHDTRMDVFKNIRIGENNAPKKKGKNY